MDLATTDKRLTLQIDHPGQLTVELEIAESACRTAKPPSLEIVPCWRGKLVSSPLKLGTSEVRSTKSH